MRLAALAILLFPSPQDSAVEKRVLELIEQLRADDLQTSDDAGGEIVRLGAPALPILKDLLLKSSGDTKLRLEQAVQLIERNLRRERAMGTPVTASVNVVGRPLPEVLEDLKKATGQPLVFADVPDDKVTVAFEKAPFWDALDAICRAHGGVIWGASGSQITVTKGAYRDRPRVVKGNLVLVFDKLMLTNHFSVDGGGGGNANVNLTGCVAWTAGGGPSTMSMQVEQFEDDKGTNLITRDRGIVSLDAGRNADPKSLCRPVSHWSYVMPDEGATKLAFFKGTLTVKYILELKKLMSVPNPAGAVGRSVEVAPYTIDLENFNQSGRSVAATVRINQQGQRWETSIGAQDFCVVDKSGKSWSMNGYVSMRSVGGNRSSSTYQLNLTLPDKVEAAALELTCASDTEEIQIPFDFKGLPLK
jgi:hypothetical protein